MTPWPFNAKTRRVWAQPGLGERHSERLTLRGVPQTLAQIKPNLRRSVAFASSRQPRRLDHRRIEVRISASDGHSAIGRTRSLRITEDGFERLLDMAMRLEGGKP